MTSINAEAFRLGVASELDEREYLFKLAQLAKADDLALARDEGWIECARFFLDQLDARIKKARAA